MRRKERNMIYQTDPRLTRELNLWGCRVMALLAIPQFVVGRPLSVSQILSIVHQGRQMDGVIVNDKMRAGGQEHELIRLGFAALGVNRTGRQVGWKESMRELVDWDYMIYRWTTKQGGQHFTVADRDGREIYDPYNEEQATYPLTKSEMVQPLLYRTWEIDA
jgi:hypothetical protein